MNWKNRYATISAGDTVKFITNNAQLCYSEDLNTFYKSPWNKGSKVMVIELMNVKENGEKLFSLKGDHGRIFHRIKDVVKVIK